ncbi:hypothetical protein ACFXPW_23725 [Streptomyces goshikiensis]|uniref:hypothetical protein n=1 Tax=Streptomyces goshikiensis TaxID=1942 RepID=UPI0036A6D0C4
MSTGDKVREIVTDVTGKLRAIAKAWQKFADDMEDIAAASNKAAQELIHPNTGEAISASADPFWARYYGEKKGCSRISATVSVPWRRASTSTRMPWRT